MKNSLYQSLLNRLKNKHAKLASRFHKSVKDGEFQKQRYRKRKDSIERLKNLEKRIHILGKETGFKISLNYKHWALALAMGVIISANAQQHEKSKFGDRISGKNISQVAGDLPLAQTVFFSNPVRLGSAYLSEFHTGDIDGDGDIDGIYVSYLESPVILTNQGSFSFGLSDMTTDYLGVVNKSILADFDGDGDLDLFMENGAFEAFTQQMWVNDGSGNFTSQPASLPGIYLDDNVHVADIDNDGDLDIITEQMESSPSYLIVLTNDNFTFSYGATLPGPNAIVPKSSPIAVMDVDGDTDIDIVYNADNLSYSSSVHVFENDGAGNFTDTGYYTLLSYGFQTKPDTLDIDDDGDIDIIGGMYSSTGVATPFINDGSVLNDGSSNFTEGTSSHLFTSQNIEDIFGTDINGDGNDGFVANAETFAADSTYIYQGNGDGSFSQLASFFGQSKPADLDGDTDADLFYFNGDVTTITNQGGGSFGVNADIMTVSSVYDIKLVDIDGDGDLDIGQGGGLISRSWLNDGNGNFSIHQEFPGGVYQLVFGDLDEDGDQDMLVALEGDGGYPGFLIYTNSGGTFSYLSNIGGDSYGADQLALADMDGDLDLDIIALMDGISDTFLRVYTNDGSAVFTQSSSSVAYYGIKFDVGDIDGDGDMDVVSAAEIYGIYTYLNDGSALLSSGPNAIPLGSSFYLADVDLADMDGDGDLDIFATNAFEDPSTVSYVFINDGNGNFTDSGQNVASGYTYNSFLGDIDGDGDVDVVVGGYISFPQLWVNDGAANLTFDSNIPAIADEYTKVVFGDLDGDSDQDIVLGGYYSGTKIFFNEVNQAVNETDSLALVAIFNATDGANWTDNTHWTQEGQDVETWYGVQVQGGRVKKLFLGNNNLTGTLPPEIGDLTALTYLSMGANNLTGSIPPEIGLMASLDTLSLSANQLSGIIPEELYNLTGLIRLSISQNELEGSISPNIANLPNLQHVALWDNPFTGGTIPDEFWTMTNLSHVFLGTSDIGGDISQFTNLTNLVEFWVDQCNVTGSISSAIGNLSSLELLDVSDNDMTGTLPSELATLSNLTTVELQNNDFSSLPDLSGLINLTSLIVNDNNFNFADIEPNVGITGFVYAPQAPVSLTFTPEGDQPVSPAVDSKIPAGTNADLAMESGLAASNNYEWTLDGAVINGATSSTHTISAIDRDKMGTYQLSITNDLATDLTLVSDPIEILATAVISVDVNDIDTEANITENINAYLFEVNTGAAVDTLDIATQTDVSSSFSFPAVVLGDFIVAVESTIPLTDGNGNINDAATYVPTYYGDEFESQFADTLELNSDSLIQIVMTEIPPELTSSDGQGVVSGTIEEDFSENGSRTDARRRAAGRKCGLKKRTSGGRGEQNDDEFQLIAYGETNDNGEFEYGFLPTGTYRFFVEYPGIPLDESAFVQFEVGEAGVSDDSFVLAVFASPDGIQIELILGITSEFFTDFRIYPNPTTDLLTIKYGEIRSSKIGMEILNMEGKSFMSKSLTKGNQELTLDTSLFPPGQYFIKFMDEKNKANKLVYRLIKK